MRRTADSSLTPQQLADVIGVTRHKILDAIHARQIVAVRDGKRFRIVIPEAIRYLQEIGYPVPPALSTLRPYTVD